MVANVVDRPAQLLGVLNTLLDRGYDRVMGPVLRSVLATLRSPELETALAAIEQAQMPAGMADRRALFAPMLAQVERVLRQQTNILTAAAESLQRTGIDAAAATTRRLAITGMGGVLRAQVEAAWNTPDPEALAAAVGFSGSDGWREEIQRYRESGYEAARSTVLAGILAGQGPVEIARTLRMQLRTASAYQANTMARTLQLVSYREATRVHQMENARVLDGIIRIAALDDRCCLCCIALHGTEYPVGTRIDDHHAGRCTSIGKVRGHNLRVQTGEAWFASLPDARREAIAGSAAYNALQAGAVRLKDFAGEYQDAVYGRMTRERSLKNILGERAASYYGRRAKAPAAPATPAATGGVAPVSAAIRNRQRGELGQVVKNALAIIDSVHKDGSLPAAQWLPRDNMDAAAFYEPTTESFAFANQIFIVRRDGYSGAATVFHEVGHFLDKRGLGSGGRWGSLQAAADPDHFMAGWWDAVIRSANYAYIVNEHKYGVHPDYHFYAMQVHELWARSYAQYIAIRSGKPEMVEEMAYYRDLTGIQWDDADFEPIALEIDKILAGKGWR